MLKYTGIKRIGRVLVFVLTLSIAAMAVTNVTYSWLRRRWTPTLSQDNISIEATGALTFRLSDNSTATENATVNDFVDMSTFVLMPVSNITGESNDFFKLIPGTDDGESPAGILPGEGMIYSHIDNTEGSWTKTGEKNGYLEFSFTILGKDQEGVDSSPITKWVYLSNESILETVANDLNFDAAQALRVSITVGKNNTKIMTTNNAAHTARSHTGVTNEKDAGGAYLMQGVKYREGEELTVNIPGTGTPIVRTIEGYNDLAGGDDENKVFTLEHFNGGFAPSDYDANGIVTKDIVDQSRCLFSLGLGESKSITVRIWLEGTDKLCNSNIAGLQVNLLLRFASVDTLLDNTTKEYKVIHD